MASKPTDGATPGLSVPDRIVLAGLFVALAITPIVFLPQVYDDFTLAKQSSLLIAAAIVLVGLALQGLPLCAPRAVRLALAAWIGALVLSELLAMDPRGSALGLYQYRQGFLTQLAYVVLLAGAMRAAVAGQTGLILKFLMIGLTGVWMYTAVQSFGADPVDWWTDTSVRAIGTIGNANELAAMAAVALVGFGRLSTGPDRRRWAGAVVLAAAVAFIIIESQSRTGLAALGLFVTLAPLAWWVSRNPWTTFRRPVVLLLAGFLLGGSVSLVSGGAAGTASRVQDGPSLAETEGSTRVALWRGTIEVIKARPWHGAGPDGLFLAFPIDRPATLGGAFEHYDLVAQSSHNLALDTTANYGLPGLVALAALFSLAARVSVSRVRESSSRSMPLSDPWTWSALGAYGALTLLNPVSLAPHAVFFVALGLLAATNPPAPRHATNLVPAIRVLAVSPAVLLAVFVAIRLPLADYKANKGWADYASGRFDDASNRYRGASRLMPLERSYATQNARSLLAAGVEGPRQRLIDADRTYSGLQADFGFTSGDAIGQATARIGLEQDESRIIPLVDQSLRLNPYGVFTAEYAQRLRLAAEVGGTLHYSDRDRWVYVEVP